MKAPVTSILLLAVVCHWCHAQPTTEFIQRKVAFYAGRLNHFGPVDVDSDFLLDKVVTNVGSAYDNSSGRFIAPYRATYQFSVTIAANQSQKAAVNVLNNGVKVMTVWAESIPNWSMSTNVAILSLEPDDEVWLQLRGDASVVYGKMYTSFSGFLLFED